MLEVKNLSKEFGYLRVVDGVSFTLRPGEIVGFLGPNGAGKSTTIQMICGLLEPSGGQIMYNGVNVRDRLADFKSRLGYVPEQGELYPHLSAYEYLELVGELRMIPRSRLRRAIPAMLDLLGLGADMHRPCESYSKGMRQKVLIAAALLHDPDVLVLDEPMEGLDVTANLVFKDILDLLGRRGRIILFSSHILEVVEKLAERVIVLHNGRIVADDSLCRHTSLESLFRRLVQQDPVDHRAEAFLSLTDRHSSMS